MRTCARSCLTSLHCLPKQTDDSIDAFQCQMQTEYAPRSRSGDIAMHRRKTLHTISS